MRSKALLLFLALITALPAIAQAPHGTGFSGLTWSRDSQWLTFAKMDIEDSKPPKIASDLYIIKADGSGLKQVTSTASNEFEPVFSRDAKLLLFGRNADSNKKGDIFSVRLYGSGEVQLTHDLEKAASPQLSPDGRWIAFNVIPAGGKPQIYVMRSDGSDVKRLTNDSSLAFYDPVWSPDGKRLVYYVEKGDQKDQIWSMKADGTDQRLLTGNIAHNFYPSWSSDGKRIFFTSNRNGKQELFAMTADGADVKAVGIECFYARQSPNGKKIAYIGGKFPNMMIYVADANGSNARPLLH